MKEQIKEAIRRFYKDCYDEAIDALTCGESWESTRERQLEESNKVEKILEGNLYMGLITEAEYEELIKFSNGLWNTLEDALETERTAAEELEEAC